MNSSDISGDYPRRAFAIFCGLSILIAFVASTTLSSAESLTNMEHFKDRVLEKIEITFPADQSIGWLYEAKKPDLPRLNPMNCTYCGEAKGKVIVQTDKRLLTLSCNNRALKDPSWLKKIPKGSIGILSLTDTRVGDQWLTNLQSISWLQRLHLSRTKITDEGLSQLRILPALTLLSVENSTLNGSGFKYLSGCKQLTSLSCDGSSLSPTNLQHLSTVPLLQQLRCRDTAIKDEHLQPLLGLKFLSILDLAQTKITDTGVKTLAHLPRLQRLDISYTPTTVKSLKSLSECKSLRVLLLNGCDLTGINAKCIPANLQVLNLLETAGVDDSLVLTMNLSQLKDLDLGRTKITRKSIAALAHNPNLVKLGLDRLGLNDTDVAPLSKLRKLESLYLDGNPITSKGIAFLPQMPQLTELRLARTKLDDGSLETLKKCKALKYLTLYYTNLSKTAVESLRKSLPNCRIEHNSY